MRGRLGRLLAAALALALSATAAGAQTHDDSAQPIFGGSGIAGGSALDVADLPTAAGLGRFAVVRDGQNAKDCTTGGGSVRVFCFEGASVWTAGGPFVLTTGDNLTGPLSSDLTGTLTNWGYRHAEAGTSREIGTLFKNAEGSPAYQLSFFSIQPNATDVWLQSYDDADNLSNAPRFGITAEGRLVWSDNSSGTADAYGYWDQANDALMLSGAVGFANSTGGDSCGAGEFRIYSDGTKLKKCQTGTVTDLDTGGSYTTGAGLEESPAGTLKTNSLEAGFVFDADAAALSCGFGGVGAGSFAVQNDGDLLYCDGAGVARTVRDSDLYVLKAGDSMTGPLSQDLTGTLANWGFKHTEGLREIGTLYHGTDLAPNHALAFYSIQDTGTDRVLEAYLDTDTLSNAPRFTFNAQGDLFWSVNGASPTGNLVFSGSTFTFGSGLTNNVTVTGTLGSTGALSSSSTVTGTRLISTIATGTAPLTVASTTNVTNLNADTVDGVHASGFVEVGGDVMTGALDIQLSEVAASYGVHMAEGVREIGLFHHGNSLAPNGNLTFYSVQDLGTDRVLEAYLDTDTLSNSPRFTFNAQGDLYWSTNGASPTGNVLFSGGTFTFGSGLTNHVTATGNISASGTMSATGAISSSSTVTGTRLIATQTTGTAPLTVSSTTAVTNLNADLLDGVHASGLVAVGGDNMTGPLDVDLTGTLSSWGFRHAETGTNREVGTVYHGSDLTPNGNLAFYSTQNAGTDRVLESYIYTDTLSNAPRFLLNAEGDLFWSTNGASPLVLLEFDGSNGLRLGTDDNLTLQGAGALTMGATGAIAASTKGVAFTHGDANQPTCAGVGDFAIWADNSENKLKKCQDGTPTDLDTGGTTYTAGAGLEESPAGTFNTKSDKAGFLEYGTLTCAAAGDAGKMMLIGGDGPAIQWCTSAGTTLVGGFLDADGSDDDEPDAGDFGNLTAGAGIARTTGTLSTASQEALFLADGGATSLTCGSSNQGKMQVMDDGGLQWCDGATTSVLRSALSSAGGTITGPLDIQLSEVGASYGVHMAEGVREIGLFHHGNDLAPNGNLTFYSVQDLGTDRVLEAYLDTDTLANAPRWYINAQGDAYWSVNGASPTGNLVFSGSTFTFGSGLTNNVAVTGTLGSTGALSSSSTVTGTRLISTIATGTAPLTVASTTNVTNLNADSVDGTDESAFALLAGRGTSQTLYGGTTASQNLTLGSTAHATKGSILFGTVGAFDEPNARLGVNDTTPSYTLDVAGVIRATGQIRAENAGAPFVVSNSTVVTNLNADQLDGVHASGLVAVGGDVMTGALDIQLSEVAASYGVHMAEGVREIGLFHHGNSLAPNGNLTFYSVQDLGTDRVLEAYLDTDTLSNSPRFTFNAQGDHYWSVNGASPTGNLVFSGSTFTFGSGLTNSVTVTGDVTLSGTGQLTTTTKGVKLVHGDANQPTCAGAGDFAIWADDSENKLKKCQDGTPTDLDTGGGAPTTAQYVVAASDAGLSAEKILTAGAGIVVTVAGTDAGTATVRTDSDKTDFLTFASLACGAGTKGQMAIYPGSGALAYCDDNATPQLQAGWLDADGVDSTTPQAYEFGNLTAGDGIARSVGTLSTASQEARFLADGGATALTCGASNQGKAQVLDDGGLQWCDGATTSVVRTALTTDGGVITGPLDIQLAVAGASYGVHMAEGVREIGLLHHGNDLAPNGNLSFYSVQDVGTDRVLESYLDTDTLTNAPRFLINAQGDFFWSANGASPTLTLAQLGSSNDGLLIEDTTSLTNSTANVLALRVTTSGTAAAFLGADIDTYLEDAGGSDNLASTIRTRWDTATAGAERADVLLYATGAKGAALDYFLEWDGTNRDLSVVNWHTTANTIPAAGMFELGTRADGVTPSRGFGTVLTLSADNSGGSFTPGTQITHEWEDATAGSMDGKVTLQTKRANSFVSLLAGSGDWYSSSGAALTGLAKLVTYQPGLKAVASRWFSCASEIAGTTDYYLEPKPQGAWVPTSCRIQTTVAWNNRSTNTFAIGTAAGGTQLCAATSTLGTGNTACAGASLDAYQAVGDIHIRKNTSGGTACTTGKTLIWCEYALVETTP